MRLVHDCLRLKTGAVSTREVARRIGAALSTTAEVDRRHEDPDWARAHPETKRKHVRPSMSWEDYIKRYPGAYRCSRFCDRYRG